MGIRVYIVHGSHPSAAVMKAMDLKGLRYSVVELPPPAHAAIMPLLFGGRTVPAVRLESGEKLQGSRTIMRRLDELAPEPALYPADPELRTKVEDAERWGDEILQPIGRDLIWPAMKNSPAASVSYGEHSRIPLPGAAMKLSMPLISRLAMRLNRTNDAIATRRLAELPAQFDRIDGWIADGVIGDAEHPNAADLQIASTLALMLTLADVRPMLEARPCADLARALFPQTDGDMPAGSLVAPSATAAAR